MARRRNYKHEPGTWGAATPAVQHRVATQVAPLVLQGWSSRKIARELGISNGTAYRDTELVRELWKSRVDNARDEWRGRLLATYDHVLNELMAAWEESKRGRITRILNPDGSVLERHEPPDPRWLSGVVATAKEASVFLGLREGADAVSRVEVSETTRSALAPMSQEGYLAMLAAAGGTLHGVTAVPPMASAAFKEEAADVEVIAEPVAEPTPPTNTSTTGGLPSVRQRV